jgi:hypothetical protein
MLIGQELLRMPVMREKLPTNNHSTGSHCDFHPATSSLPTFRIALRIDIYMLTIPSHQSHLTDSTTLTFTASHHQKEDLNEPLNENLESTSFNFFGFGFGVYGTIAISCCGK